MADKRRRQSVTSAGPLAESSSRRDASKKQSASTLGPSAGGPSQQPTAAATRTGKKRSSVQGLSQSFIPALQPQPKVAIPRLRKTSEVGSAEGSERHRVSHACEACRQRKVKCTGERPSCRHCLDVGVNCVYKNGKRAQFKRDYDRLVGRNEELEKALRQLSVRASADDREAIKAVLDLSEKGAEEESGGLSKRVQGLKRSLDVSEASDTTDDGPGEEGHGEEDASGSVGSNEPFDALDEDLARTAKSRATGFIGKNSEVQWLRRLKLQIELDVAEIDDPDLSPYLAPGSFNPVEAERSRRDRGKHQAEYFIRNPETLEKIRGFTYHLDDVSVLPFEHVDPYELPLQHVAENLLRCYLETVHDTFPCIAMSTFVSQFNDLFRSSSDNGRKTKVPAKWYALLNLIFAIGAKYSHLLRAPWRGDERDHLIYHTRARALGLNGDSVVTHPDHEQLQIIALLTLYYTSISQISRAWNLCGLGIRYAVALGLHVRNEDQQTGDTAREIGVRVWWTLYSLEYTLSVLTGRPGCLLDEQFSVPLPSPFQEDVVLGVIEGLTSDEMLQDTVTASITEKVAMHFKQTVKLAEITRKALSVLYSRATSMQSWEDTQRDITDLDRELESWRSKLPPMLDFSSRGGDQRTQRKKNILGMLYHRTRVIITRPCLCEMEGKIEHESAASKDFNYKKGQSCVRSAMASIDMIPDEPNTGWLSSTGPWWCQVHHLMQAASVLMLEVSMRAQHLPDEMPKLIAYAKKIVRWLQTMSADDPAADRAWGLTVDLLRQLAPKVDADVSDLTSELAAALSSRAMSGAEFQEDFGQSYFPPMSPTSAQAMQQALQSGEYQSSADQAVYGDMQFPRFDAFSPPTGYPTLTSQDGGAVQGPPYDFSAYQGQGPGGVHFAPRQSYLDDMFLATNLEQSYDQRAHDATSPGWGPYQRDSGHPPRTEQ